MALEVGVSRGVLALLPAGVEQQVVLWGGRGLCDPGADATWLEAGDGHPAWCVPTGLSTPEFSCQPLEAAATWP